MSNGLAFTALVIAAAIFVLSKLPFILGMGMTIWLGHILNRN